MEPLDIHGWMVGMIKRWRLWYEGEPPKNEPFICDWRSYDIPNTVVACIRSLPANCVAITLRPTPWAGRMFIPAVERAARKKGIRIIWVPMRAALLGEIRVTK